MKKVKLNDLGRGAHFFLESAQKDRKVEFVIVRHFPERADDRSPMGYALVEAAGDLFQAPFDKDECNDWRGASLRKLLNGDFLDKLLEDFLELKDAAVTFQRDLTADDGLKDYGTCVDTVSLLTADEYRENRDLYMEAPGTWRWFITPNSTPSGSGSSFVRYVSSNGSLYNNYARYDYGGVRPALYLKSGLLVSVEGVDECKDELTPEQKEMALYEAAVEKLGRSPSSWSPSRRCPSFPKPC